ncbi:hypothetical protein QCN27_03950 [Cereibacter sp. SYSU M97828]|nr:hypothetical protein [Cereibacter flavus]
MGTTILIKSPSISSNPNLPRLRRDPIWDDAGNGGRFGFDLAFPWSYPLQAAPVAGTPIMDTSEFANGLFQFANGTGVTFSGNGFDFSAIDNEGAVVKGGSGSLASIFSGAQHFLVTGWMKMPTQANWNTHSDIAPVFGTSELPRGYTSGPELLTVVQGRTPGLQFRRQTAAGAAQIVEITDLAPFYGRVCQWAYWRNAKGVGAQVRSSEGVRTVADVVGANNAGDFSGQAPMWGVMRAFNAIPDRPEHVNAAKWRLYRGHLEDLAVSGRDPLVVVNRDWEFASRLARYS